MEFGIDIQQIEKIVNSQKTILSELSTEKKVERLTIFFNEIPYIQEIRVEDKNFQTPVTNALIDNQLIIRINIDENKLLALSVSDSIKKFYLKLIASLMLTIFLIVFPLLLYQMIIFLRDLYHKECHKNETIWRTVSIVRHNIKQPLNIISLRLQMLNEKIDLEAETMIKANIRKDVKKQIHTMLLNIDRINQIIETFDKPDVKPIFGEVNICSIIDKYLEFYYENIHKQNISVSSNYVSNINIIADISMIEDIIQNLIANAIQAQPDGGYIDIIVKKNNSRIIFTIENSASNLDVSTKEYLIEPYYSTKSQNMGLGLFNVNERVKAHNGNLTIDLKKNVFRIIIYLPITNKKKD